MGRGVQPGHYPGPAPGLTGDRLQIALVDGSILVHRDPAGAFEMGPKPYLVLPATVRHRSGVRPGERVLVAADPHHDVLVVHR